MASGHNHPAATHNQYAPGGGVRQKMAQPEL